jgi:hypothetical protein
VTDWKFIYNGGEKVQWTIYVFHIKKWNKMPEYERIRFYNILEHYKFLYSLGKSVQTAQILIQLIVIQRYL